MRAPEPCYPSFSLALEDMERPRHQSLANTSVLSEGSTITVNSHRPRDPEDPLMQTVYYSFQESSINFTYPFDVVSHKSTPSNATTLNGEPAHAATSSPFIWFLCIIKIIKKAWNRVWMRRAGKGTSIDLTTA